MKQVIASTLLIFLILSSCKNKIEDRPVSQKEIKTREQKAPQVSESEIKRLASIEDSLSVMVIPCSNGYVYNQREGDLNPFLIRHIQSSKRKIVLEKFNLKTMRGTMYAGVYDKKYCKEILKRTDVQYLIMTRMKSNIYQIGNIEEDEKWGYETKILNTRTMDQFKGISGNDLPSYHSINADIGAKIDILIDLLETNDGANN